MAAQLKVIGNGLESGTVATSGTDRQKALEAALAQIDRARRLHGQQRRQQHRDPQKRRAASVPSPRFRSRDSCHPAVRFAGVSALPCRGRDAVTL